MTSKQQGAGVQRVGRGARSLRGLGGWIGIGVLVLGSIAACDSSDDSTDVSSPSTEAVTEPTDDTQTTDTPSSDAPTTTQSPTTTVAAELVTMIDVEPVAVASPFAEADVGDGHVTMGWIVPWQEGFLAVGTVSPAAQLPEEVVALFPPEVVDLFPDGLPSVGEAMAILEEAGLYQVVSDIVSANPAAYDAIFPPPPVPPVPVFTWSEDGEAWTQLEGTFPDDMAHVQLMATGGDQLVVAGLAPTDEPFPQAGTTMVSTTSDLSNWTTHVTDPQLPADLPDDVRSIAMPVSLVANETGWVLEQAVSLDFQPLELLPSDLADRLITEDLVAFAEEDGVRIQPREFDATGSEELLLTWEELGFDDALLPYLDRWDWGAPPTYSELWSASWTGNPVRVDTGQPLTVADSGETLVATSEGFLWLSEGISYSADGLTWTVYSDPSPAGSVPLTMFDFAAPIPDGVAVVAAGGGGASVYRVDPTGQEWELLEVSGLPDNLGNGSVYGVQAHPWIVYFPRPSGAVIDQWLLATADGERWLVDDLDDEGFYLAAVSGSVLLVGTDTGEWMRYDLAS